MSLREWIIRFFRINETCAEFDGGPDCSWDDLFKAAPVDYYKNHSESFYHKFGPVFYRGRLDGSARILVIGQDPSTDETLVQRAFVGNAGQKVQTLLHKGGITKSYIMVNTFLFGISRPPRSLAHEQVIADYRNTLLDRIAGENNIQLALTFGNVAKEAFLEWFAEQQVGGDVPFPVFHLMHPSAGTFSGNDVMDNWNSYLPDVIRGAVSDDSDLEDPTPFTSALNTRDGYLTPIPREDLPFGVPEWHGRKGTQSERDSANEIIWKAPD